MSYPDVNSLELGSRWRSCDRGRNPERSAVLRGLSIGRLSRGRRLYAFAIYETPPDSGSVYEAKLDDFVNAWWRP